MFANTIQEIDAAELAQWVSDANHQLRVIDVRQMQEIATGTVPRAEALPLHTLPAKVHELSPAEKLGWSAAAARVRPRPACSCSNTASPTSTTCAAA